LAKETIVRTTLFILLAAGLLAAVNGQDQTPNDARAVIQKAIQAHGGAEVLNKFKAARSKTRGKMELLDGVPFTQEMVYQLPNQFRETTELDAFGQKVGVTTVFDGEKAWLVLNANVQEVDDKLLTELKEAAHLLRAGRLTYLLEDPAIQLSLVGELKVNDRPAVGIKVERKGNRELALYFDKESGLLTKTARKALEANSGQEIAEERIITEYQKVAGMQSPRKLLINRDGKKFMEAEVTEIQFMEKATPESFAKPSP
jgi:hypothetical protein